MAKVMIEAPRVRKSYTLKRDLEVFPPWVNIRVNRSTCYSKVPLNLRTIWRYKNYFTYLLTYVKVKFHVAVFLFCCYNQFIV